MRGYDFMTIAPVVKGGRWYRTYSSESLRKMRLMHESAVKHETIAQALEAKIYVAHPYTSCEYSIIENTDGLLRQVFLKHTDFRTVLWQQIKQVADLLNHRPRKTRGYRSPNQLFYQQFLLLLYPFITRTA